jgi:hypothetical protein
MKKLFLHTSIILVFSLLCLSFSTQAALAAAPAAAMPAFFSFEKSVFNGQAGLVRGVYLPDLFALPIEQQPAGNPLFVSQQPGVLTDFNSIHQEGSIGLLAHNYLAGRDFASIKPNQEAILIYGDGRVENFIVTRIYRFQALSPNNPHSDFIDLETGAKLSAAQVYAKVYTGPRHLTFQTCIYQQKDPSWGRLFVIAEPFNPIGRANMSWYH